MSVPHIYVINLKRSPERRDVMGKQLDDLGLDYSFIDGIDGKEHDFRDHPLYDRKARLRWYGRDLLSTEIACLLSHRAAYQTILDEDRDNAVILEDDVVLAPDFPEAVKATMAMPASWDMIRFLDNPKTQKRSRPIAPVYGNYVLSRLLSTPGGGYAYLLNRKAAQRLLDLSAKVWQPIDVLYGYTWRTHLETYAVIPSPVRHRDVRDTLIGDTRFDKTISLKGWKKARFPFFRAGFKFYEMLFKRLSNVRSWWKDRHLAARMKKKPS